MLKTTLPKPVPSRQEDAELIITGIAQHALVNTIAMNPREAVVQDITGILQLALVNQTVRLRQPGVELITIGIKLLVCAKLQHALLLLRDVL